MINAVNWSADDQVKYINMINAQASRVLDKEEEKEFIDLFTRKAISTIRDPKTRDLSTLIGKSMALVDDMVADGAVLSSSEKAEMGALLFEAGDEMIKRFALIKKAGRPLTPAK